MLFLLKRLLSSYGAQVVSIVLSATNFIRTFCLLSFSCHVLSLCGVGVVGNFEWIHLLEYVPHVQRPKAVLLHLRDARGDEHVKSLVFCLVTSHFVQSGLCISRGSGAVLNVNCALILLPTCKFLVTFMHRASSHLLGKSLHRLVHGVLNQMGRLHVLCAITILVASGSQPSRFVPPI